jgi:hypothetical protein
MGCEMAGRKRIKARNAGEKSGDFRCFLKFAENSADLAMVGVQGSEIRGQGSGTEGPRDQGTGNEGTEGLRD